MLSKKVLEEKVARHQVLAAMMKEMEAESKEIEDALKKEMERRNVEELAVGTNVVRWTSYVKNCFDSSAFKKAYPDIYAEWQKQVSGHRFSVT